MRKEDLEVKKKLLDHLEASETQFSSTSKKLSMDLNRTMSDGFNMMCMMFQLMQECQTAHGFYQGQSMRFQQNTNRGEDNSEPYYTDL